MRIGLFDKDRRRLKKVEKIVRKIEGLADEYAALSDKELQMRTPWLKERLAAGETLDDILPDAYAAAREACRRVTFLYPYHEQLMAGVVLHHGDVAEQKTGEGKTLTAVMPTYLNALEGKGVHVVTVNEYLSERDALDIGRIYRWMGLSIGLNKRGLSEEEKKRVYQADITYTTNSEVGFDYLRDNMVKSANDKVMRGMHFALVDECDSILIDESRTPLIISGGAKDSVDLYILADRFVKALPADGYDIDLRGKNVTLTDKGITKAEKSFKLKNLYSLENTLLLHRINQALRANKLMKEDIDYVVDRENQEIIIVDPNTGRLMKGREWSDGLHQAVEAKEGIEIKQETVTKATITYQNFFRMYDKLAGMTGTAKTEEEEFREIYNMLVYPIPTHKPVVRIDYQDAVYGTKKAKYAALVNEVKEHHAKGQPVLVGTIAVETSELISKMLQKEHIPHEVLNAKNHAREAEIIANAGQKGAVTIATNMAGRGTDIKLGEGVAELGGLCVLGSERHESRRIDNQLRGRSGRQGDPGESRFFVSLQDDLMVRFGSERMEESFKSFGDQAVESKLISKAIENAQKRVEGVNYDSRKALLKYDDVMRMQREMMYGQRDAILNGCNIKELLKKMFDRAAMDAVLANIDSDSENINENGLRETLRTLYAPEEVRVTGLSKRVTDDAIKYVSDQLWSAYMNKCGVYADQIEDHERKMALTVIDDEWVNNIDAMDKLRNGIGLRSYAQEDPLNAYMEEGFRMFDEMAGNIAKMVVTRCNKLTIHVVPVAAAA